MTINIDKLVKDLRLVGGIHNLISNEEIINRVISENNNELIYAMMFVEAPYNHFNYYFLQNFEKKYSEKLILGRKYKSFFFLAIDELKECYKRNVYGKEKTLWGDNGKSLDATFQKALKNISGEYLTHIRNKGFSQLADLLFDFYIYFPFADNQELFERNFWPSYKEYLENEWKPVEYPKICGNWNYGSTSP